MKKMIEIMKQHSNEGLKYAYIHTEEFEPHLCAVQVATVYSLSSALCSEFAVSMMT